MRTYADDYGRDDYGRDDYGRGINPGLHPDLDPSHSSGEAQDITLGMPALLGIFFAVVLVCAVFFGFGYSTGRIFHGKTAAAPAQTTPSHPSQTPTNASTNRSGMSSLAAANPEPQADTAPAPPPLASVPPASKPRPGAALGDEETSSERARPRAATVGADTRPGQYAAAPVRRVTASPQSAVPASATAPEAPQTADQATSAGIMVQIAAVAHPADAQTLAQALRKNGYPAVVRTEPQDKFLHVQIGPFATRDQAKTMRARLAENGYNAFLKQ
jgi:hypothetical protein